MKILFALLQSKKIKQSWKQEVAFILLFFIVLIVTARAKSHLLGKGNFWDIFTMDIIFPILICLLGVIGIIKFRSLHYHKNIKELKSLLSEYDEALVGDM